MDLLYQGNVDDLSEHLFHLLSEQKLPHDNALRIKLLYENLLLDVSEKGYTNIHLTVTRSFMSVRIYLTYPGHKFNPLVSTGFDESTAEYNSMFYENIGLSATYSYTDKTNRITGIYQSPPSLSVPAVFIPILSAVLAGLIMKQYLSADALTMITEKILQPLFTIFMKLILMIVTPLVFFSQIEAIGRFDKLQSLSRMFTVFLKRAAEVMLAAAVVSLAVGLLFWGRISGGSFADGLAAIRDFDFTSLFSDSMLQPFLNNDLLQVVVIATLIGIGLLSIGERKEKVLEVVSPLTDVFQYLLKLFSKLMPAFIFISILSAFLNTSTADALGLLGSIGLVYLADTCALLAYIGNVARITKTKAKTLIAALRKPFTIAFTTASAFAARSEMYDTAKTKLHVDNKVSQFVINIGSVVLWPVTVFNNTLCIIFIVRSFSASLLIPFVFASIFLAVATPTISGGGVVVAAALLQVAGVKNASTALQMYILMNLITDYFVTAGNVCSTLLESHYCSVKLKAENPEPPAKA
jgi:Na+/H+-dicarboxylate symporter